MEARCVGVSFMGTHCEGANFVNANCGATDFSPFCQGADFQDANFRGSYDIGAFSFSGVKRIRERIGENTELRDVIIAGELEEVSIQAINRAKPYIGEYAYNRLQEIIEKNKGVPVGYTVTEGMMMGVLEDSEELQKIIEKLVEIEKKWGIVSPL